MIGDMRRFSVVLGLGFILGQLHVASADDRSWNYLIEKLVADGVPRERVVAAFSDPRVAPFAGLEFSANPPRESRALYRRFLRPSSIAAARRCRLRYAEAFEAAERAHGVSANVLAAILYVESGCGRNTGSSLILYRLARLAMANEPDNLHQNIERFATADGELDPVTVAKLRARARYLEATFYPEVRALFDVADRMGVDPLSIRGSGSGAFGYPQFLPTSYLQYGTDGDGDGHVSLYQTADAVASCARYFAGHGWRPDASAAQRRAAVWEYNHSAAYVDTVLTLAARIGKPAAASSRRPAQRKHAPPRGHHHRGAQRATQA